MESWEEHQDGYFREGEAEKQRAQGTGDLEHSWDLQALCSELATNFHLPLSFQSHAPEILGSKSPSGQLQNPQTIARGWCGQPRGDGCGHVNPAAPLSSGRGLVWGLWGILGSAGDIHGVGSAEQQTGRVRRGCE